MIALACLACTGLAVWLAVGVPPARRLSDRLPPGEPPESGLVADAPARHRLAWPLGLAGSVASVVSAAVLAETAVAVGLAAGAVAGGTAARLIQLAGQRRAADRARAEVAHACRVVAGQLRVGRVPAEALRMAADDCAVLTPAVAAMALGADPAELWQQQAQRRGYGGLRELARAWTLSTRSGAPLAPALERVSGALADDLAVQRLVAAEASAARATGKLMAALPLVGLALGYLIGGRPLAFLLAGPVGWGCLLGGVILAAVGVSWIERLARRATEAEA